MKFGWEVAKLVLVEAHAVRVAREAVAIEAAWDIGAVPYEDLGVGLNWLEEEDSVAGEDAIGERGHRFCRHLGNGEAVGADMLEGGNSGVTINHSEIPREGMVS